MSLPYIIVKNMQTAKAVLTLEYNGEKSELDLLKAIHPNPGRSIYELSKLIAWSYGKTQQAVQRLIEKGLIEAKQEIRNNRLCALISETPAEKLVDFSEKELELMQSYLRKVAEIPD